MLYFNIQPVEEIIKYCDKLMEDKIHSRPLVVAIECALRRGYTEAVLPLFRVAKEKNIPIKQHYFWPLIVSKGKDNDIDGNLVLLIFIYFETYIFFKIFIYGFCIFIVI